MLDAIKKLAIDITHPRREFIEHLPKDDIPFSLTRSLLISHGEHLIHDLAWLDKEYGIHYDLEDFPTFPSELPNLMETNLKPCQEWIQNTHGTSIRPLQIIKEVCCQFEQLKKIENYKPSNSKSYSR